MDYRVHFIDVLGMSFIISFVLLVFQPFGMSNLENPRRFWVGLGFGGVSFLMGQLSYLWVLVRPRWFTEHTWTLGREFLWATYVFLAGALGIMAGGQLMIPEEKLFDQFGMVLLITIAVGLFPYLLMVYINHNRCLRRYLLEAQQLETELKKAEVTMTPSDPILSFTDEADLLPPIHRSQWLFLEAEGNYLRLWTRKNGQITDYRLRNTIKDMHKRLEQEASCFQSHRAFLINIHQVQHIEGNSAGYRLRLDASLPTVPVSRAKTQAFREVMATISSN